MSFPFKAKSLFCLLILTSILFSGCPVKEECAKFIGEEYPVEQVDSIMLRQAPASRDTFLNRFGETPVKGLPHTAYHLLFYSSHGYGQSIKFEKKDSGYFLSVKCVIKLEFSQYCNEYEIKITKEEWNQFEDMIYEFNFWTAQPFKANEDMLDGYVYFLEGNRPEAEKCNKRAYHFVGRSSPRYDKIGALCDYIIAYEDQLAQRYDKREVK